ncbi:MAG: pyridoxal-phosphate dependent enzyme [Agathobacter sp.]|nr:pyridoxal-phosphate dependent enzyme [Agathobacter sp.]
MINFSLCTEANIQFLGEEFDNNIYVLREDLIPYSFGGNKARKAILFFREIDKGDYDCVVTYGGSHSNHCRVVANMAKARGMECYIVGPDSVTENTNNSRLMDLFGARLTIVPVEEVKQTIDNLLSDLRQKGRKPYFIVGGGHGNIGTSAYVSCYSEIKKYEEANNKKFDYIFFASGTGTTQAGLVSGQIINGDDREIIGISIARNNPRGRSIIIDSIREYLPEVSLKEIERNTHFIDKYVGAGYGADNTEINQMIKYMMCQYGMPLDTTYTGKAMYGMAEYIREKQLSGNNILFIHTGGTPLFFDDLRKW